MKDAFKREIDYLRISVTDRCNLRCLYCMPDGIEDKKLHDDILRDEEIIKVVEESVKLGISKIRITVDNLEDFELMKKIIIQVLTQNR